MDQKPTYQELEQRLAVSEKVAHDLELVYNSVNNSVITLDPDQNIISVNSAAEKLIGSSESELLNKKCYEVLHTENSGTRPDFCPFQELFSGEVFDNVEAEIELRNGNFLVSCTPVFDKEGKLDRILHVSTNITPLKNNEKKASMLLAATRKIPLSNNFNEAARSIYDICKDHIGATCGYVAMKSDNEEDNDLIFLDDGGLPCFVDPSLPMPIRGLRKEAYDTGAVAYSNNFMNSTYKKYMPEGHMDLNNVLFAPLKFGDDVAGVIGLANKDGGFNEHDIDIANAFGEVAALALRHSTIKENLIEKEKFSSNLLDHSPNPILVIDKEKSIAYTNKSFEKLSGYGISEVIGLKPPYPWWTQDTLEKIQTDLAKAIKKGATGMEEKFQKKNGEIFHVEITSAPVTKDGDLDYYLANWLDITDRKRTREELKRSEKLHRTTIENISDAVFITDEMGMFTYICPNTDFIFGLKSDEIAELKSIEKLFGKRIYTSEELDEKNEIPNILVEVLRKNNRPLFLLVNVKKVEIEDGAILYTCRDITEKKIAEEALKETQNMFLKVFQNAPVLITLSKIEDGTYLEVNDTFVKFTGYNKEDVIGKTSVEIGFIRKKDRDLLKKTVQKKGYIRHAEFDLNRSDGSTMTCLYSAEVIEIKGIKRLLSTAIDISERKQQQVEIQKKQDELEAHTLKLEQMNTALNVLMDHRDTEKRNRENEIIENFKKLIFPYFDLPIKDKSQEEASLIFNILNRNIREILFKGNESINAISSNLTPLEIQVANLIRESKSTKEIANILQTSVRTIYFHRENIRKKLNLTGDKINLKSFLQTRR